MAGWVPPIFLLLCTLNVVLTDDMPFLAFDSHFETKVSQISQIINKYYNDKHNGKLINNETELT